MIKEFNKIFFEKKVHKLYKYHSKIINYVSFFVFISIYYLYFVSLEKYVDGHRKCSKRTKWIRKKLKEGLICSLLLIIICELMIQKIISKIHLIHIIISFLLFYIYSHGLEFDDHGLFNLLGVLSIIIIGNIFFLPFNLLFCIKKKNKLVK